MKKNPKILLIYPSNQLFSIETPRPDGSLGILYLAGALEDAGFETDVLDASIGTERDNLKDTFYRSVKLPNGLIRIGMSSLRIKEVIADNNYDILGISSNFTPQTSLALEVASIAKSVNRKILVIAGGVNARNLPERFLDSGSVDIVCLSEGEKIVVGIVKRWIKGNEFCQSGIMHGNKGNYNINPVKPENLCENLDDLPFPAWRKLIFKHYDNISSSHAVLTAANVRYAPIMTSRGCPFHCAYCHNSMENEKSRSGNIGSLRLKSVKRVLKEAEILKSLEVKKLYFEDDSLLAKKSRVKEIFTNLKNMNFQIEDVNGVNILHFMRRGKNGKLEIDIEYLEFLKSAGLEQIVFPVESGSQRVLNKYATSKINLKELDAVNLVKEASRAGIRCPINIMIGFPDETETEILESVELGEMLVGAGAPYCTFFIVTPFPGSKLYEMAVANGNLERNFDPDVMNWKNAIMKNTVVPAERIMELRDLAWEKVNNQSYKNKRFEESAGARRQNGF